MTPPKQQLEYENMLPVGEPERDTRVELGNARALRARDHAAIIYWTADELLDHVVPYLIEGLRVGDKVVYVAHDLSVERIAGALSARGVDVGAETKAGRLTIVAARDAFFGDGKFDVERAIAGVQALAEQSAKDGFSRVRFSVEMTYLLAHVPGIEHGPEFEARANEEVFARFPFVCICSFNGARDQSEMLTDVLETHPILIANGIPLQNPYYRPWDILRDDAGALARRARRRNDTRAATRTLKEAGG